LREDFERVETALQQEVEAHQQTADALAAEAQMRAEIEEGLELQRASIEQQKARLLVCSPKKGPLLTHGFPGRR